MSDACRRHRLAERWGIVRPARSEGLEIHHRGGVEMSRPQGGETRLRSTGRQPIERPLEQQQLIDHPESERSCCPGVCSGECARAYQSRPPAQGTLNGCAQGVLINSEIMIGDGDQGDRRVVRP